MVKSGNIFIFLLQTNVKANSLTTIIGTYECKVDNKARLMIPAPLKKQLHASIEEGFVLKRSVFQPCLELYPMSEWELLMKKMNGLNRFNKKNNDFIRKFTAGVKLVEIDNLGRLLIPKDLMVFAQIDKDIVLSSAVNILEIWDKNLYEKSIRENADSFSDLAEEVMGSIYGTDDIS